MRKGIGTAAIAENKPKLTRRVPYTANELLRRVAKTALTTAGSPTPIAN